VQHNRIFWHGGLFGRDRDRTHIDERVNLEGRIPRGASEEFLDMVSADDLPPSIDVVTIVPEEIHSKIFARRIGNSAQKCRVGGSDTCEKHAFSIAFLRRTM